ncbi:hypothetical protein TNCV_3000371 [Trichonephila clavipes]|nr:hypothetical protein TNCV_3000371 [Trichonephila clavipes]
MVSQAVQGQVRHPSIVPEFLRSTSYGMTSARGHWAIVYCLNSGSEDRQTGHHNMLCELDTRNNWRDGQVCPDVGQGTMAPWARRLGFVLACYAQIGRGEKEVGKERREERERGDGRRRREETKKERGRESRKKSGENGRKEKEGRRKRREREGRRDERRRQERRRKKRAESGIGVERR